MKLYRPRAYNWDFTVTLVNNMLTFRLFFVHVGDQLDGPSLHVSLAGFNDSQSDANITQDEIIDHGNQDDQDNLQYQLFRST